MRTRVRPTSELGRILQRCRCTTCSPLRAATPHKSRTFSLSAQAPRIRRSTAPSGHFFGRLRASSSTAHLAASTTSADSYPPDAGHIASKTAATHSGRPSARRSRSLMASVSPSSLLTSSTSTAVSANRTAMSSCVSPDACEWIEGCVISHIGTPSYTSSKVMMGKNVAIVFAQDKRIAGLTTSDKPCADKQTFRLERNISNLTNAGRRRAKMHRA